MTLTARRAFYTGIVVLLGLALGRAANFRFRERETAFRQECQAQLKQLGMTRGQAKAKYPTPEITLVSASCLLPGATGEVVIKGKFIPGTKFIFENDNVEVVKESLTATEYRATVKAAPGVGPQSADVMAISPVTGITARSMKAVRVAGAFEWTMTAENGWKIVARSPANKGCKGTGNEQDYDIVFYRAGEAAPFEKRKASFYYSMYEKSNHQFQISQQDAAAASKAGDYQALMMRLSDQKLSAAEREKLMQQLQEIAKQQIAEAQKMRDAAYMQQYQAKLKAQRDQFGCERIELEVQGPAFTGRMRCSPAVGARIALTGTLKMVGQ